MQLFRMRCISIILCHGYTSQCKQSIDCWGSLACMHAWCAKPISIRSHVFVCCRPCSQQARRICSRSQLLWGSTSKYAACQVNTLAQTVQVMHMCTDATSAEKGLKKTTFWWGNEPSKAFTPSHSSHKVRNSATPLQYP